MVLSFSGPAAPEALAAGVRQLTAREPVAFDVFEGLEPAVAALAANALNSPVKRDVLAYMHRFTLSTVELSDLVYRVGASEAAVTQALDDLIRLDLVCRLAVCDLRLLSTQPRAGGAAPARSAFCLAGRLAVATSETQLIPADAAAICTRYRGQVRTSSGSVSTFYQPMTYRKTLKR